MWSFLSLSSLGSGLSEFTKRHKRKVLFVGVACALGYAGYRVYSILNDEISQLRTRMKKDFGGSAGLGGGGSEELRAMRLEQLFAQSQAMCDEALVALCGRFKEWLYSVEPSLTAAELKDRAAQCTTRQEKAALFQRKIVSTFVRTACALYFVALSGVALKAAHAAAAAAMAEEANALAAEAEESEAAGGLNNNNNQRKRNAVHEAEECVARVTTHLLMSTRGMAALREVVRQATEETLQSVPLQQNCGDKEFVDLWKNIRAKIEDFSSEGEAALEALNAADAARRSLLRFAFPFSVEGTGDQAPHLMARVEAALSGEEALRTMRGTVDAQFEVYLRRAREKLDPNNVLPLLRIVPLVEWEVACVLEASPANAYHMTVFSDEQLTHFAESVAELQRPYQSRRVLFVCDRNVRESLICAALARLYGGGLVDVYTSAGTLDAPAADGASDARLTEALGLLGFDMGHHVPRGLRSVPKDVVFDAVVVLGSVPETACAGVATKKLVSWRNDSDDPWQLRDFLDSKVRGMLLELGSSV